MPRVQETASRAELDKQVERHRYESRAQRMLRAGATAGPTGLEAMRPALRAPYVAYESALCQSLAPGKVVLELGAGSGMHTETMVATGATVIASDISESSLRLLARTVPSPAGNLSTQVADMERLPFADRTFDVVACAGALSYGDALTVADEILRVLRPGGRFICVDSLNANPIYRMNRWLHYLRGERSRSTLLRMPSLRSLEAYRQRFSCVDVAYFGAVTFLVPLLATAFGEQSAARIVESVDRLVRVKGAAFKFVMVATKG
jgi:ubiquinone/menaquinone biosynthesis C-methylase UbiE